MLISASFLATWNWAGARRRESLYDWLVGLWGGRCRSDGAGRGGGFSRSIAERLQDNPGGIDSFLPFLQRYECASLTVDQVMELPFDGLNRQDAPEGFVVRKATMEDFALLIELFADADDMARTPPAVERPLRDRRYGLL